MAVTPFLRLGYFTRRDLKREEPKVYVRILNEGRNVYVLKMNARFEKRLTWLNDFANDSNARQCRLFDEFLFLLFEIRFFLAIVGLWSLELYRQFLFFVLRLMRLLEFRWVLKLCIFLNQGVVLIGFFEFFRIHLEQFRTVC
jgi:hypothetical protein